MVLDGGAVGAVADTVRLSPSISSARPAIVNVPGQCRLTPALGIGFGAWLRLIQTVGSEWPTEAQDRPTPTYLEHVGASIHSLVPRSRFPFADDRKSRKTQD